MTAIPFLGLIFRTIFLVVLIAITARVASPQNETVLSSYETLGDLIRLILGLAVAIWLLLNIFRRPKDGNGGYRAWALIGPVVIPLAVLCAFVIW